MLARVSARDMSYSVRRTGRGQKRVLVTATRVERRAGCRAPRNGARRQGRLRALCQRILNPIAREHQVVNLRCARGDIEGDGMWQREVPAI